jgi:hypothetical protein
LFLFFWRFIGIYIIKQSLIFALEKQISQGEFKWIKFYTTRQPPPLPLGSNPRPCAAGGGAAAGYLFLKLAARFDTPQRICQRRIHMSD